MTSKKKLQKSLTLDRMTYGHMKNLNKVYKCSGEFQ